MQLIFEERTRPACCRRRLAVGLVLTILATLSVWEKWLDEICGETPQITRETRVLPFPTAYFRPGRELFDSEDIPMNAEQFITNLSP
jgi:hypothetical protein